MTSRPVRIFVAPGLARTWAPEVQWTFQTLLTSIGRAWQLTTDPAVEADISYSGLGEPSPAAPLVLRADPSAWATSAAGAARRLDEACDSRLWGEGGVDVVAAAFGVLTGADERSWRSDRHGHHVPPDAAERALPQSAVVSRLALTLDAALRQCVGGDGHAPWPEGKAFAAVSTHDVDYPQAVRWLEPWRAARRPGVRLADAAATLSGRLHHWHFDSWIEQERRLGIASAFFFVARPGSLLHYATGRPDPFYDVRTPRFRSLLREIAAQGFEVGWQPSYDAWRRPEQLQREKDVLEDALGDKVHGGRHHYWRLDPRDPEETLLLHERLGLLYDCSLSYEGLLGWRRGLASPFRPYLRRLRRPLDLVQLPTPWMDDHVFGHATLNGVKTDQDRQRALSVLVDRVRSAGGVFVSDVHEYVFDERLHPGRRAAWEGLWQGIVVQGDAWVASPAAVVRRWRGHEERLVGESRGLL